MEHFFLSRIIVFTGVALITNHLKIGFRRIRPEEIMASGLTGKHACFAKGDRFPSGHTSYYFSLFFPTCYFFDRSKSIIATPLFIALGRVIQKARFFPLMPRWAFANHYEKPNLNKPIQIVTFHDVALEKRVG